MIKLDFYLKWGSIYSIDSFGCPTEQIMFLGRSNGFIICCSESGLHEDWLKKGFATQIPSAMAEHVYMVPESVFYPKNRGQYPEHIYESKNFETVDSMIGVGLINESCACQSISYLWDLDENSDEVIIYKWFVSKLLTVSDLKASEKNLRVYLKIAESMMKKASIKNYVIDIYTKYMAIVGADLIHNAEQRFESIREFQVNQLPF